MKVIYAKNFQKPTKKSCYRKTDIDKNYQAFKDAINKAGFINVIIQ